MKTADLEIHECTTVAELDACVQLQRAVFGLPDLEISPRRHLVVSRQCGGWTLGAFQAQELVGFVHYLIGVRAGELIGYSHMMAVAAHMQNSGIGAALKWAQRERALGDGRRLIRWTWDPMQARNAHFNLNRLGAVVRSYATNFYGTDYSVAGSYANSEPAGIDSDRLFAEWNLDSPRVTKRQAGASESPGPAEGRIEIPAHWSRLVINDPAHARAELLRVRTEFATAFASGLVCAGFERASERSQYLLYTAAQV